MAVFVSWYVVLLGGNAERMRYLAMGFKGMVFIGEQEIISVHDKGRK
jgi:hypothetical protein